MRLLRTRGALRLARTSAAFAAVFLLGQAASAPPARAVSPSVVISQVYGGGGNSGATFKNDFIELFNRGDATVSLAGWSVQYASATGNFSAANTTSLTGSLAPGQYYLVQEAAGGGGTKGLPTPDATGGIAMSATTGKVALVNATTALSGSGCPLAGSVVDFLGYGTASCFEGSVAAGLTNTTAALRAAGGCTDTDNNASDFATGAPNPRNTATVSACGPGPTNPTGSGAASPVLVHPGATALLTVAVSPGQNPTSSGLSVTANLTAIGGAAAQALFDDHTHGDAAAGGNVFSFLATAGPATGLDTVPITPTDAQGRTGSTTGHPTVQAPAPGVIPQAPR